MKAPHALPPRPTSLAQALEWCASDPEAGLLQIQRIEAEESLIAFVQLMWHVLEPGRPFVSGWVVEAMAEHLEAVTRGEITNLVINVPPGFTKSMLVNVFWPAWEWGPCNRPELRYVNASYAEALSVRDNRRCRLLIQSDLYQQLWGDRFKLMDDQNAKVKYENSRTGFRMATSMKGIGTGERGDRFITDDPHSVQTVESDTVRDATRHWFSEVRPTRVNDIAHGLDEDGKKRPPSANVLVMQRVHEQDVSALAIELGWDHLVIPMEHETGEDALRSSTSLGFVDPRRKEGELAWPERFPREALDGTLYPQLRAVGGDYAIAGQMQQRPSPRGGGMFAREDWRYVRADEVPFSRCTPPVRGWDFAATERKKRGGAAARSAAAKMVLGPPPHDPQGERTAVYVLDVTAGWWSPGQLHRRMLALAKADGTTCEQSVPQDPGQAGKDQVHSIRRRLAGFTVHASPEQGDKVTRAGPLATQVEGHNVYLVECSTWNSDFVAEGASFPRGRLKDQIDAASRAYARLLRRPVPDTLAAPQVIQ